jgi:hypothetical protein
MCACVIECMDVRMRMHMHVYACMCVLRPDDVRLTVLYHYVLLTAVTTVTTAVVVVE